MKRWGKSPPHSWQHGWHGKPRLEQGQACGESCHLDKDAVGRLLEVTSDRDPREMIVTMLASYRTRLIDWSLALQRLIRKVSLMSRCLFFTIRKSMKPSTGWALVAFVFTACAPRPQTQITPSTDSRLPESPTNASQTVSSQTIWVITPGTISQTYLSNKRTSLESQDLTETRRDSNSTIRDFTITTTQSSNAVAFAGSVTLRSSTTGQILGTTHLQNTQRIDFSGHLENGQLGIDSISDGQTHKAAIECDSSIAPLLPIVEAVVFRLPAQLTLGMKWTDTVSISSCQGSIPVRVTRRNTYVVGGEQNQDGRSLLLIDRTDSTITAGEGALGQHWLSIRAKGTGSTQFQLNLPTGALVHSETQHTDTIQITVSGRTQKLIQATHETVSLTR